MPEPDEGRRKLWPSLTDETTATLRAAEAFEQQRRYAEAAELLSAAVEQHPLDINLRNRLIRVYLKKGDEAAFRHAMREYEAIKGIGRE